MNEKRPDPGLRDWSDRSIGGSERRVVEQHAKGFRPILPASLMGLVSVVTFSSSAMAQASDAAGTGSITVLALIAIAIATALVSAVYLMQYRAALTRENGELRLRIAEGKQENHELLAILAASDQRLVIYGDASIPSVFGELPVQAGAPEAPSRFLEFPTWLPSEAAGELAVHIEQLTEEAKPFLISLDTLSGELIEATGRTHGARAIVRFTHMAGLRAKLKRAGGELAEAIGTVDTLQALLDTAPTPAWLRDDEGKIYWVNRAYARAVDADTPEEAVETGTEFFGETDRSRISAAIATGRLFSGKLSTVVDQDRHIFDVTELSGPLGTAGLAIDVSEAENIRRELHQTIESQSETLDKLGTAVARFDPDTRLAYHNAAFRELFGLTESFLQSDPDHVAFLDHLRHGGVLPTETAFPSQKRQEDLAAYSAAGPTETMWHLHGGRTLRVVATPSPQGGATFVFEDITERLKLEIEVKTVAQLQRETLDHLSEGVAVFGSDGRLRLSNPIFAEMFGLEETFLQARPRIQTFDKIAQVEIEQASGRKGGWGDFAVLVTAIDELGRSAEIGEIRLSSGLILAYKSVPLPNAQTMLTFSDVSDARAAERMLIERNDALEEANRIKYDFVSFMSYELRSPLTTVIGFSQLLAEPELGTLNERQTEYLSHISSSTRSLLAMVNDTLDLATIDANIMELEVSNVDIAKRVENAIEGVQERLHENALRVTIDLEESGGHLEADGARLTQILYNLLSNAANFAPQGSEIALRSWRDADEGLVFFSVTDHGPGIEPNQIDRIFDRFETNSDGGRSSGPGLGLSIVKSLVELHGGAISVQVPDDGGTTIVCALPAVQRPPEPDHPLGADATEKGKGGRQGKTSYQDAAE